jgi:hypothetical protein
VPDHPLLIAARERDRAGTEEEAGPAERLGHLAPRIVGYAFVVSGVRAAIQPGGEGLAALPQRHPG